MDEERIEYIPGEDYTNRELEQLADQMLRDDTRSELCRECKEHGELTGGVLHSPQDGHIDNEGNVLVLEWPEYKCKNAHYWFKGEGRARGIGGENPILFEEHFKSRRRREIYCTVGTPDPEIVSGIYNRVHPQGRKVNSKEQRARHGASFYR